MSKHSSLSLFALTGLLAALAACGGTSTIEFTQASPESNESQESVGTNQAALTQDGLALAFSRFKTEFVALGRDRAFDVGLAPFTALGTENIGRAGLVLNMEFNGSVATGNFSVALGQFFEIPSSIRLELWAGRNVAGTGKSIKPESGDAFTRLGVFAANTRAFTSDNVNLKNTGTIDFLALTRGGSPAGGTVAMANLTLFEKTFFAQQFGWSLSTPAAVPSSAVATNDERIQRGFQVFFSETFAGNGRTCGSCHRAENNFTIDQAFIATLPNTDPLLQAAINVPGLEGQNGDSLGLLKNKGLILENVDGLSRTPVFRSVQHTFGLTATTTRPHINIFGSGPPDNPPDERLGWSGDGAPGRGTLHDFAVGAIVQHLTKNVQRRVGTDFRLPTQEELDSLEAFQLSIGRSKDVTIGDLAFLETAAQNGKTLFTTQGLCNVCHANAGARSVSSSNFNNLNLDQGVERRPETLALGIPKDSGFGTAPNPNGGFGDGRFNVQSIFEAADSPPFFHNNSAATLEDAVRHYTTPAFVSELAGFAPGTAPNLNEQQVQDVAAFLRVLNSAENVRQVRQRLEYVRDNPNSPARGAILTLALADTDDALQVLDQPGRTLSPASKQALLTLRQVIVQTQLQPASTVSGYASVGVSWCQTFVSQTFTANPNQDFLTD